MYEVELLPLKKAYFTVHSMAGELTSGDIVELNGLYASKLGFKDGDPVNKKKISIPFFFFIFSIFLDNKNVQINLSLYFSQISAKGLTRVNFFLSFYGIQDN